LWWAKEAPEGGGGQGWSESSKRNKTWGEGGEKKFDGAREDGRLTKSAEEGENDRKTK